MPQGIADDLNYVKLRNSGAAFKEFSARNLAKEKKPSIRKLLKTMKEKAQQKTRQREKVKTRERGVEL